MSNTTDYSVTLSVTGGFEFTNQWDSVSRSTDVYPEILTLNLAPGNNTINASANGTCVIIPPSDNTIALTIKGVSGDTGTAISKIYPTLVSITTDGLVLNCASTVTIKFVFL